MSLNEKSHKKIIQDKKSKQNSWAQETDNKGNHSNPNNNINSKQRLVRALIKRTDILFTLDKLRPFITHAHIRRIQQIIIPRHTSIIMTRPWYIMIGFLH